MLQLKNVKKSFGDTEVLKNISMDVHEGDVIAVLGPSGSGKTTLLRCISFLTDANEGQMIIDGQTYNLAKVSKKDIHNIRKKLGFVFQSYNLFANKTALENVTEGLIVARKMKKDQAKPIAEAALEKVGMLDRKDFYPASLSGGQQQRVAIARAIALNPEVILFDEPTSALDPELTGEVLDVMKKLADEGTTMLVVTHEMGFARNVADRIIFMENGLVVEESSSAEFFTNPKEKRSAEFIQMSTKE